jgi:hypothetical protein
MIVVVLLAAPLVRRWTGSVHVAAMLVCSAAALAVPVIALQSGGLAAPMIVIVPLIPLMMATFLGRGGTLYVGALLAAGLVVVGALGRAPFDAATELPRRSRSAFQSSPRASLSESWPPTCTSASAHRWRMGCAGSRSVCGRRASVTA